MLAHLEYYRSSTWLQIRKSMWNSISNYLPGLPRKSAYFSFICSLMKYGTLSRTHTKSTTMIQLRKCSVELQDSTKTIHYTRYSNVSYILDELERPPLSQRRQEASLFFTQFNGLAQVPFEGILIDAYKCTRRKYNKKCRQIGHTNIRYG